MDKQGQRQLDVSGGQRHRDFTRFHNRFEGAKLLEVNVGARPIHTAEETARVAETIALKRLFGERTTTMGTGEASASRSGNGGMTESGPRDRSGGLT